MRGRRSLEPEHKLNEKITAAEVRVVGENIEPGIYPRAQAIKMAQELEMDLIKISGSATPPVCRIWDYRKFLYEQKKKLKEIKAKQTNVTTKEIRFGPNTDDHDFDFKLKHARTFLQEGSKVRAYVHFKGRSIVYKERGEILLTRFIQELMEFGLPEQMPKLDGKRMFVIINPKKK